MEKILKGKLEKSLVEAVLAMEARVGEGVSGISLSLLERNQFGRLPLHLKKGGLAYAVGLSRSGIRAAAFLSGSEFEQQQAVFQEAVSHRLPVVAFVLNPDFSSTFPFLLQCGGFAFLAKTPQEAVDLGLIAHRVAEAALLPGVVLLVPEGEWADGQTGLSAEKMQSFLGDPDEQIEAATPAQQLLFGKMRRRIPRWFNTDLPALHGSSKTGAALQAEQAAGTRFMVSHLRPLIAEAAEAYKSLTGRLFSEAVVHGSPKSEHWMVADWTGAGALHRAVEQGSTFDKSKVGVLDIRQWAPFPTEAIVSKTNQKSNGLTIFEPALNGQTPLLKAVQGISEKSGSFFVSAQSAGVSIEPAQVSLTVQNISKGGAQKSVLQFGTPFTRSQSVSPQHEVLLQSVSRAYPGIEQEVVGGAIVSKGAPEGSLEKPSWAARRYRDQGPAYTKLTRFYQDTGYFYNQGLSAEIVADPFQAVPVIPAASAVLADYGKQRTTLPVFSPSACTACGACFTACPHAALPPVALKLEQLLKGGMDISARQGTPLSALTPLVKNLALRCGQAVSVGATSSMVALLDAAFETLRVEMRLEGEKLEKARHDVDILGTVLSEVPLAFTEHLFGAAEQESPGSGYVFSLATDPTSCVGCGICAEACPEDALRMEAVTPELRQQEARVFHRWEQLPDTDLEAVQKLGAARGMDPFAVRMLQRIPHSALAGGSALEAGTLHKTTLRALCALMESERQAVVQRQIKRIRELTDQISARVHQVLSDALPKREFTQLEQALESVDSAKTPLDTLLANIGGENHLSRVDTQLLQRQTHLVKELKDLEWLLKEGPSGAGRATYGIVANIPEAEWLGHYPWNHFTVPVLLAKSGVLDTEVLGIIQGQMRHWMDNIRLIRRGVLEASGKYQPHIDNSALAALSWNDLDADERQSFPPLLLVLEAGTAQAGIEALLSTSWPVKVLLLDSGSVASAADIRVKNTLLFSTLGMRHIPVVCCSAADSSHAYDTLKAALALSGPALIHWFSPDISGMHSKEAAVLALRSRAFPLLRFLPDANDSSVSINENPDSGTDWVVAPIPLPEGGDIYSYTYADWLAVLPEWSGHFRPWRKEEGSPLTIPLYLQAEGPGRKGKVPVVAKETTGPEGFIYLIPSEEVLELTRLVQAQWGALQAFAGAGSVARQSGSAAQLEQTLRAAHEAEITGLHREFEKRLEAEQVKWKGQVKDHLRDKLLALSKMKK